MGNGRLIFEPGQGSTIASYTAAVANGTMYPGDWVMLNTQDPTAQGVTTGYHRGKLLGASDYIECTLLISTALGYATLGLGCLHGKTINAPNNWENVSGDSIVNGEVAVIQDHGVHPQGAQADTGLLGDYLYGSTVGGEPLNGVLTVLASASLHDCVGVVLENSDTYQRVTAADTHGSPCWVDCA